LIPRRTDFVEYKSGPAVDSRLEARPPRLSA
jgi:hypothetical protein